MATSKVMGPAWLGPIPPHWPITRIKYLARIYSGGTPDREKREYWEDGTIPWLNSGEVNQWLIETPSEFITEAGFQRSSAKWIPKGALVMALAGQGKTKGMVAELGIDATCNQSMAAIVPTDLRTARFLLYWLSANYETIRNTAGGEQRDGLNLEIVGDIPCPNPDTSLQVAIANYLDHQTERLEALIMAHQQLHVLLAEKRVAFVTQAVTRGLDLDVPLRPSNISWLGHIPAHWQLWKLGHLARVGNGSTPSRDNVAYWQDGTIPWLNSAVVNQAEVTEADEYVTSVAERECHLPMVAAGSVLVGLTGQGKTRGQAAVLSINATINQHLAYITPDHHRLTPWFLRWQLFAAYDFLRSISDDAGGTKGALTCEEVANLRVAVPPLEEQRAILEHLDEANSKIHAVEIATARTTTLLQERRASLIAAAVTGRVYLGEAQ